MAKKEQKEGETQAKESLDNVLEESMIEQLNAAHTGMTPLPLVKARMHNQLLERITAPPQQQNTGFTRKTIKKRPHSLLDDGLTVHADEGEWIQIKPKVAVKPLSLDREAGTRSFLMRLDAGAQWPAHMHSVDEECVVLQGNVSIGDLTIQEGDYHLAPKGMKHEEFISEQGALLFLRAGIKDTELSFGVKANYVWQRINRSVKQLFD
jgi:anti-sigma factor ChrR (cupin superfamily)